MIYSALPYKDKIMVEITYSYATGISEIKKALKILQKGRIGIGKIAFNLVSQSSERKPITLRKISNDSGVNYSTLKTYYKYHLDIIQHLDYKPEHISTMVLAKTAKRINEISGHGYTKIGKAKRTPLKKVYLKSPKEILSGLEVEKISRPEINRIFKEENERKKSSVKLERELTNLNSVIFFLREYQLTRLEIKNFSELNQKISELLNNQSGGK